MNNGNRPVCSSCGGWLIFAGDKAGLSFYRCLDCGAGEVIDH